MLSYLILHPIVPHTVIEHQFHVPDKFLNIMVHIEGQLTLDRHEIHRLGNYLEVIVDPETTRVHRLVEEIPAL